MKGQIQKILVAQELKIHNSFVMIYFFEIQNLASARIVLFFHFLFNENRKSSNIIIFINTKLQSITLYPPI